MTYRSMQTFAAIVAGITLPIAPVGAATLYVASNGTTTGTGTEISPLKWVTAASRVQPGDTIILKPGVYTQSQLGTLGAGAAMVLRRYNTDTATFTYLSGTAQLPIVVKAQFTATDPANVSRRTIIRPESPSVYYAFSATQGQQYIEVRGIEFDGINAGDHSPDASGTQVWTNGLVATGTDHITFADNIIHDFPGVGAASNPLYGNAGAIVASPDYITITGNIIYKNCFWDKYQSSGISLHESKPRTAGDTTFHNLVSGNIVYANASKFTGVSVTGDLHHTDGNGIIIDTLGSDAPYTLVENNVSYQNGGRGIHVFNSDNTVVRNNTTYHNTQDDDIAVGGELTARGRNILFINNIAVADGKRPVTFVSNQPGRTSTVTFSYNLYSNSAPAYPPTLGTGGLTVADPQFVNASGFDFHCLLTSPAVDSGTSLNFAPLDRENRQRPLGRAVDRGAYEVGRKPKQ